MDAKNKINPFAFHFKSENEKYRLFFIGPKAIGKEAPPPSLHFRLRFSTSWAKRDLWELWDLCGRLRRLFIFPIFQVSDFEFQICIKWLEM